MHHTMDGHDDGLCFVPWSVMSVCTRTSVVLSPRGWGDGGMWRKNGPEQGDKGPVCVGGMSLGGERTGQ